MSTPPDPRPAFQSATTWVTTLMRAVTAAQLTDPTPCADFDVRALCAHLIATVRRAVALGEGTDIFAVDVIQPEHDVDSYAAAAARAIELWSEDAKLTEPVRVPWGEVPGAGALWGYTNEALVHGWDLAQATGQPAEADPATATAMLAIAQGFIPAERGEQIPFEPPVPPRPGAGPTEMLANWSGRRVDWRRADS